MKSVKWVETLNRIKNWFRTDYLASPKKGDVRINDEAQRDLWRRRNQTVNEREDSYVQKRKAR